MAHGHSWKDGGLFSSLPLTKSENENVFAVMLSVVLCIKYVCVFVSTAAVVSQ